MFSFIVNLFKFKKKEVEAVDSEMAAEFIRAETISETPCPVCKGPMSNGEQESAGICTKCYFTSFDTDDTETFPETIPNSKEHP